MNKKETIADIIFPESTNFKTNNKYADEKYIAEKLDGITRSFRAIRGNWHTLNPYLQSMFKIVDDYHKQSLYKWVEENYMKGEWQPW